MLGSALAIVLGTVGNAIVAKRGHRIPLYVDLRDVGVFVPAAGLALANVAVLRRHPASRRIVGVVLLVLAAAGTYHLLRHLDGSFLCR